MEGCESLSGEIVIPYGITEIRLNSFAGCTALAQVVIGKNVKEIHEKAFYGCVAIDHVLFEAESEAIIEAEAFGFCWHLKEVILPTGVKFDESSFPSATNIQIASK